MAERHYIDEERMLVLLSVARGAEPPADLTVHERTVVAQLTDEITNRPDGAATEVPVDW